MAITSPAREIPTRTVLELDGASLTIRDALEVSRRGRTVQLSETAARAVNASKQLKEWIEGKDARRQMFNNGAFFHTHTHESTAKAGPIAADEAIES